MHAGWAHPSTTCAVRVRPKVSGVVACATYRYV